MAYSEVGSGSQRATKVATNVTTNTTQDYPGNVTAGNLIVVAGALWNVSAAPTSCSVTTNRSADLTVILGTIVQTGWRNFIAFGLATSSGACTITVDPPITCDISFAIDEWAGAHASPTGVNGGTSTGNTTTDQPFTATDSLTTVVENELIIGVMSHNHDTTTLTAQANCTTFGESENNSGAMTFHAVFKLATSTGSYSLSVDGANASFGFSPGWSMMTHSFVPAAEGPPGPVPSFPAYRMVRR